MKRLKNHLMNVGKISLMIGRELSLNEMELIDLYISAKYHDIGKVKISKKILNKKSKLTNKEFEIIKLHPKFSHNILSLQGFNEEITKDVLYHHEKFDGTGYVKGLKGKDIPLNSRIISVADAYDAITSVRAYSDAKSHEFALNEIKSCSGKQFDPDIVLSFLDVITLYKNGFIKTFKNNFIPVV